jgi:hypothetical protein
MKPIGQTEYACFLDDSQVYPKEYQRDILGVFIKEKERSII